MKILILTNENHTEFILRETYKLSSARDFLIKCYGEFDWSNYYDIGISFMYQYKVPKEQIDGHTWFNFHPAPLPEYKGRNLCYQAIMNGEKEFGATLHYMDENFDTGDIIEVERFAIHKWDTSETLSERTIDISKNLFSEYLPLITENNRFAGMENMGGSYYKKEPIPEYVYMEEWMKRRIRAITYGDFYPKVDIGGVTYKIVRDE